MKMKYSLLAFCLAPMLIMATPTDHFRYADRGTQMNKRSLRIDTLPTSHATPEVSLICNSNQQFAKFYCGGVEINVSTGTGPDITDNCFPLPWKRYCGTPQIMNFDPGTPPSNPPNQIYNAVYTWSYIHSSLGFLAEGIFTGYTFTQARNYKVKARYLKTGGTGNIVIRLANSVTSTSSFTPVAPTAFQEVLYNFPANVADWQEIEFTITPNASYSNVLIYPSGNTATQVNLYLDYVSICPDECSGTLVYNQGVVPASSAKYNIVNVGSSFGGSGTVTINSVANTSLLAASEINIASNTELNVSGAGSFTAEVQACAALPAPDPSLDSTDNIAIPPPAGVGSRSNVFMTAKSSKPQIAIFPNPSHGDISIQVINGLDGPLKVDILDAVGNIRQTQKRVIGPNDHSVVVVDLRRLARGIYICRITDGNGNVATSKFEAIK